MKLEKQIEACAALDGWVKEGRDEDSGFSTWRNADGILCLSKDLPDYDSDNEIDRMVRELSFIQVNTYWATICEVTGCHEYGSWGPAEVVTATPALKRMALLRVAGKWEEEVSPEATSWPEAELDPEYIDQETELFERFLRGDDGFND